MTATTTPTFSKGPKPRVRRWTFLRNSLAFLLTLLVIALLIAVVKIYDNMTTFSPHQKTVFTSIFTALSIVLALTFFTAFKSLAQASPPHILHRFRGDHGFILDAGDKDLNERLTHLIETIDEWGSVSEMIFSFMRLKRILALSALAWLIFFLAAQGTVAAIGPQVSVVDGTNYTNIVLQQGRVELSNNTCYFYYSSSQRTHSCSFDKLDPERSYELSQALAADAGRSVAKVSPCRSYSDRSEITTYHEPVAYYCGQFQGRPEFAYRFSEFNPADEQRQYPSLTNRYIVASSGPCFRYGLKNVGSSTRGNVSNWEFEFGNATYTDYMSIPVFSEFYAGTNYAYRGMYSRPQNDSLWSCGPRCLWMWAHKSPAIPGSTSDSLFFQCPITIGEVVGATEDAHNLPDDMAKLAAASIGLSGHPQALPNPWTQFQFFPAGTDWAVDGMDPDAVGHNMAEYAIGSISSMASNSIPINATGKAPILGAYLDVKWGNFGGILAAIGSTHLIMLCLTVYLIFKSPLGAQGKSQ